MEQERLPVEPAADANQPPLSDLVWSQIHAGRDLGRSAAGSILQLPIVRSNKAFALEVVRDGDRVLDVGAHDRALGAEIERRGLRAEYRSVDPDPSTEHDHASIRDVNEAFDVVILLEVIEHLPLDAAVALMRDCAQRVAPGGWFVVSTPNVHHPTWFWRDPSHITAFRYTDLLGILHYLGLRDFEVARVKRLRWRDRLRAWRYRGLLKLLSADFAPGIVVRCRRPAG